MAGACSRTQGKKQLISTIRHAQCSPMTAVPRSIAQRLSEPSRPRRVRQYRDCRRPASTIGLSSEVISLLAATVSSTRLPSLRHISFERMASNVPVLFTASKCTRGRHVRSMHSPPPSRRAGLERQQRNGFPTSSHELGSSVCRYHADRMRHPGFAVTRAPSRHAPWICR